jgi:PAS domain-containing protein
VKPSHPTLRDVASILDDPAMRADLLNALPSIVWCADGMGLCSFVNQRGRTTPGSASSSRPASAGWKRCTRRIVPAWNRRGPRPSAAPPLEMKYRLRRADGAHGWIHHAAVPVNDEAGKLAGYLGTCHDITEQRTAELSARAKEQQIRLLADNVPVLIAYFDAKSLECLFANKNYAKLWA